MSRKNKRRNNQEPEQAQTPPPETYSEPAPQAAPSHTLGHAAPVMYPPAHHYPPPPQAASPFHTLTFLIAVAASVGLTMLLFSAAPHLFLKNVGQGKAGTNCKVQQVKYDPAGNAVLSFRCGEQEKDVTIARGKTGPKGDSCSMQVDRSQGDTQLVFKCGNKETKVSLPKAQAPLQAGRTQQPQPAPQPAARPAPQPAPRPAARPAPQPQPTARPTPRPAARPKPAKDPHAGHNHGPGGHGTTVGKGSVSVGGATFSIKGAPGMGSPNAKVKVVVFSDFQCPFCARGMKRIDELRDLYKDKIFIVFKHLPLSFHQDAHLAAQAAMAANEQGKFWAYHDKLFTNQSRLKKNDLIQHAKDLGLNIAKFKKALDTGKYKSVVDKDMADAKKIKAPGTPFFLVNGEKIMGARPINDFKAIIDKALGGSAKQEQQVVKPKFNDMNAVTLEGAPTYGPKDAKVTVIEFSDFECPFCSRGSNTVAKLRRQYGNKVRFIYKHLPLQNHPNAHIAAQASMAANEQGKFWEYHDKLFASQDKLKKEDLLRYAKDMGMDMAKFKAALDNGKYVSYVNRDMQQAQQMKVNGTPIYFINGYKIPGAYPYFYFKQVIDAIVAGKNPPKFQEPKNNGPQFPTKRVDIPVSDNDPSMGPKDAPVTIVEFSDFECSFCARGADRLRSVKKLYGDKVRIVYKHQPLDMHPNAHQAAQASLAAHAQGKFWPYHYKLFQNTKNLNAKTFDKIAQEVGLDMDRFRKEMNEGKYREAVQADRRLANKVGATSTPIFFINGHPLLGAQPFFRFRLAIDAALKGKKMPDLRPIPPKEPKFVDILLHKYDATYGPKDAKVTVIEFSDFECGFCKGASATLNRLKKEYGDRVRFIFKHLPIKFHKQAHLAAQASLAANEQGKFWEFHDLLFKNQQKMKKPDLLRYAKQLNLDMKKFKKVLDSGKYKQHVSNDYDQARWWGIDGTPAFVVNGKLQKGAVQYNDFKKQLDKLLKK
ncbi:MAG: hypothetical protein EP343_19045 [Deltaproteobacteria bacterium]|nr:MAG: hypothetical protein EP343_19045 [Deltaproteobacteria bacterium]